MHLYFFTNRTCTKRSGGANCTRFFERVPFVSELPSDEWPSGEAAAGGGALNLSANRERLLVRKLEEGFTSARGWAKAMALVSDGHDCGGGERGLGGEEVEEVRDEEEEARGINEGVEERDERGGEVEREECDDEGRDDEEEDERCEEEEEEDEEEDDVVEGLLLLARLPSLLADEASGLPRALKKLESVFDGFTVAFGGDTVRTRFDATDEEEAFSGDVERPLAVSPSVPLECVFLRFLLSLFLAAASAFFVAAFVVVVVFF